MEFINCDIRAIPTRGILLSTRRPILIQGNRFFRTSMHGILIEDDAQGWYESGPVHDLTVRGNSFFDCAESVIQINPHYNAFAGPVHRNITVENNVFTLTGNGAAYSKAVDGLTFHDNRFRMRNGSTPQASSLVSTNNTTGLSFSGNLVEAASAPAFVIQIRVSLDFIEAMPAGSPLRVGLLRWDGRLEAADGTDTGTLETLLSLGFASPGTELSVGLDLSELAAGTRLWLCYGNERGTRGSKSPDPMTGFFQKESRFWRRTNRETFGSPRIYRRSGALRT